MSDNADSPLSPTLLIAPEGIEMPLSLRFHFQLLSLLIAPEGIEIE